MTLDQARTLVRALEAAIAQAEATGAQTIDMLAQLRAVDAAARADLDAAIKAASQTAG